MSAFFAVFKRELKSLWVTPLAWVLLVTFLVLQGGIFYSITVHLSKLEEAAYEAGPIQAYFGQQSLLMSFTLLLLCPGLSMRSFAEERRTGSIEALLSAPVSSTAISWGKYLGILSTYTLIWLPTLLYIALLRGTGAIHLPTIVVSYAGVILLGASYLALGVFLSALAKSQLIALLLSTATLFGFFVLGIGEYAFEPGLLRSISGYVSPVSMLEETAQGLIDTRRVVLHLTIVLWSLFLTTRIVDSWRSA